MRSFIPYDQLHGVDDPSRPPGSLVCGTWVRVLPQLGASGSDPVSDALASAIRTLALSITARITGKPLMGLVSTYYGDSLRGLRRELGVTSKSSPSEHLATIMCLALSDVSTAATNLAKCFAPIDVHVR